MRQQSKEGIEDLAQRSSSFIFKMKPIKKIDREISLLLGLLESRRQDSNL